jgi:hypothetical protein
MNTCIHQSEGLCPTCQADHDEDPLAWAEFGNHPQGIANWHALQAELEAYRAAHPERELTEEEMADIPF